MNRPKDIPSTSFDSRKLQSEIENMKKMRQNYGTDWLLSTSSLLEKAPQQSKSKDKQSTNATGQSSNNKPNQMNEENDDDDELATRVGNILESFAVYRSIEFSVLDLMSSEPGEDHQEAAGSSADEDVTRTVCILSIGERCLVEKDEANAKVLCLNEIANLSDIKLNIDSKFELYFIFLFFKFIYSIVIFLIKNLNKKSA